MIVRPLCGETSLSVNSPRQKKEARRGCKDDWVISLLLSKVLLTCKSISPSKVITFRFFAARSVPLSASKILAHLSSLKRTPNFTCHVRKNTHTGAVSCTRFMCSCTLTSDCDSPPSFANGSHTDYEQSDVASQAKRRGIRSARLSFTSLCSSRRGRVGTSWPQYTFLHVYV